MSTLRANTIQDAAGANSMPVADINQGRAKAWLNMNGTGTIAVRDSFNVASIVDVGTGSYQANITIALANTNYVVLCGGINGGICLVNAVAGTVSRWDIITSSASAPNTSADVTFAMNSAIGD